MSAHTPTHVCSDADCCYRGQPSSRSCRCHKPATQMMREQIDALVKALRESAADIVGSCKNPEDPYIAEALRRIGDVLASVGEAR